MTSGGLQISFDRIAQAIDQAARRGGDKAAQNALNQIQRRAPVRKIFKGTTFRGQGINRRPRIHQLTTPRDIGGEKGERIRGHANSIQPLLRNRVGGTTYTLVGDFRRVDPDRPGKLAKLEPGRDFELYAQTGGRIHRVDPKKIRPGETEDIKVTGGRAVTGRGRYEIRSGRANFRAPGSRHTQVGGRLRGELHIEGPVDEAGVLRWYIVSRTKDPQTGYLYGRAQEFGTRRHKPQPFMRPGLHASRDSFRKTIRGEMKEGLRKR